MHEALINVFGGSSGIRDEGALASALIRPQLGYYNSLTQEAAALMESLANNHPFIDGKKRVAYIRYRHLSTNVRLLYQLRQR